MKLRRHQHAGAFGEPDRVGGPLGRMPLLALTLLGATLLLGVLVLALPRDPGHAWQGLKDALQDPRVLVPLAALTAVGILACTRAWTYRHLLYLPGPILALPLEAAGTGEDPGDRSWLAPFDLRLRQRLSELRLSAATAAGSAPSFVELLETSTIDPKQPFAAIGRMLALVRPTHAYEVRATLIEREKAPSRGVAMEIVILPQRRTILRTYALTAAAVCELRKAAGVGGSAALAARWDWILSEDPDLAGLRGEPAFRRFETEWLPGAQPVAVRPRQIVRLRASRWSVQLCRLSAACIESVWHARAALEGPTDIHEAIAWWRDEEASWELARELVHHHRHWQTRLKVIESMQCFADRNGTRFRARHPRYMDRPIEGDAVTVDRVAGNEIHFGDLRLNTLADVLGDGRVPGLGEWDDYLLALDKAGRRLEQPERTLLAANRATAWGSLRRVFSEETAGGQRLEDEFRRRIEAQFREVHLALTICPPPVVSRRFEGSASVVVTELQPPFTV